MDTLFDILSVIIYVVACGLSLMFIRRVSKQVVANDTTSKPKAKGSIRLLHEECLMWLLKRASNNTKDKLYTLAEKGLYPKEWPIYDGYSFNDCYVSPDEKEEYDRAMEHQANHCLLCDQPLDQPCLPWCDEQDSYQQDSYQCTCELCLPEPPPCEECGSTGYHHDTCSRHPEYCAYCMGTCRALTCQVEGHEPWHPADWEDEEEHECPRCRHEAWLRLREDIRWYHRCTQGEVSCYDDLYGEVELPLRAKHQTALHYRPSKWEKRIVAHTRPTKPLYDEEGDFLEWETEFADYHRTFNRGMTAKRKAVLEERRSLDEAYRNATIYTNALKKYFKDLKKYREEL